MWWRSACENNDERRGEGEDNVFGGESVCENNDERRREGHVCGGESVCENNDERRGEGEDKRVWWRECMRE